MAETLYWRTFGNKDMNESKKCSLSSSHNLICTDSITQQSNARLVQLFGSRWQWEKREKRKEGWYTAVLVFGRDGGLKRGTEEVPCFCLTAVSDGGWRG